MSTATFPQPAFFHSLLNTNFNLPEVLKTVPPREAADIADAALPHYTALTSLAELAESLQLTQARVAALQALTKVAQGAADMNVRRLAAAAILKFNPDSVRPADKQPRPADPKPEARQRQQQAPPPLAPPRPDPVANLNLPSLPVPLGPPQARQSAASALNNLVGSVAPLPSTFRTRSPP